VISAARESGRTVGRDLSVAGFDDIFISQLVSPALTTIRQQISQLGRQAAETAVAAIAGRTDGPGRIVLPVQLVIRGSTARVPRLHNSARPAAGPRGGRGGGVR